MIKTPINISLEKLMTARLMLRRPLLEDRVALSTLWSNQTVRQFLGGVVSENFIDEKLSAIHTHWHVHGFGQWTLCLTHPDNENNVLHTQEIIGLGGLHHSEDGIELSYMFLPEFWGQGFAEETAKAALDCGFNIIGLKEIIAIAQENNYRSCHLLEKIGMCHIRTFNRYNAVQRLYSIRK